MKFEQSSNLEKQRIENQERWESSARTTNKNRNITEKLSGKNKVTADAFMMAEDYEDNASFVKPRHKISIGKFVSGYRDGHPVVSDTVREIEGMPNSLLRIDFADSNLNLEDDIKKIAELPFKEQREYLRKKIELRKQVFKEIEEFGIAVPRFKSFVSPQGERLGSYTVARRVEGKAVFIDELSQEMISGLIDSYFKLADYYLHKSRDLNWDAILKDVKGHQFLYGSVLGGPDQLYYVDIGMEGIMFVDDYDGDSSVEYLKTNAAYYRIYDLLDAVKILEKEMKKIGCENDDRILKLREKLNVMKIEAGDTMMKYAKPLLA